jgi:hypothetical protein
MSGRSPSLYFLLTGAIWTIALLEHFSGGARLAQDAGRETQPAFDARRALPREDLFGSLTAKLRQWQAASDPSVRRALENELDALLTDANAADIFRWLPREFRETPFGTRALKRWSKCDPAAAVNWLAESPSISDAEVEIVLHSWIKHDIDGLRQYLENVPEGDWKQRVLATAADGALASDCPQDAIVWLSQLTPQNLNPDMMDAAAQAWAAKDLPAAIHWADTQGPESSERLLAAITVSIIQNNPRAAIQLVNDRQTGDGIARAVEGIVSTWAAQDPVATANWVIMIPEGDDRTDALHLLLYAWSTQDASAAQQWISSQLTGAERDQALTQLTSQSSPGDFATAAKLVAQISPGQIQNDLGAGIVRRWATEDFGRASAWVNSLPAGSFQQLAMAELAQATNDSPGEP